ncbi:MAG: hypothetical protein K0R14_654 [Burkholderiales bacterium]|jgi:DNA-binding CsgD family transcriptional regulator|nr:hypothetical protein [Burkholderiales bacterium]
MDDKKYFAQYKKSFETIFSADAEEMGFLKNSDFKFQAVTNNFLKTIHADTAVNILNKTLVEFSAALPESTHELVKKCAEQDVQIGRTKHKKTYLGVVHCEEQVDIFLCYKTPIINPETGNFLGIRGQMTKLLLPNVIKVLFKMHGGKGLLMASKSKEDPLKEYPLSHMQRMVLFMALNNYSYSEIALLLNEFGHKITPVRVNDYLEQLKLIFHVGNKNQLIEKAIGLNLHTFLPAELFSKTTSIEINDAEAKMICSSHCH